MNTRETAMRVARLLCQQNNVQLLDQTVALEKIRIRRTPQGRMTFMRIYAFEYTADGNERYIGRATMLGMEIKRVVIEDHQGVVIDHE